ncbi:MAG TPA: hypothetical protein VFG04_27860 [Planctomycetaceae bacterium]|jgi:hypothetical protein|nr:hypothetical protein [Planctomycetaceae bacterium]
MSDEPRKWSRKGTLWAAIAVLVLAYPLSAGPILWYMDARFYSLYEPLFWMAEHSRIFGTAFFWYMSLWGHHFA